MRICSLSASKDYHRDSRRWTYFIVLCHIENLGEQQTIVLPATNLMSQPMGKLSMPTASKMNLTFKFEMLVFASPAPPKQRTGTKITRIRQFVNQLHPRNNVPLPLDPTLNITHGITTFTKTHFFVPPVLLPHSNERRIKSRILLGPPRTKTMTWVWRIKKVVLSLRDRERLSATPHSPPPPFVATAVDIFEPYSPSSSPTQNFASLSEFSLIARDLLAVGASETPGSLRPDKEAPARVDDSTCQDEFATEGGLTAGPTRRPFQRRRFLERVLLLGSVRM